MVNIEEITPISIPGATSLLLHFAYNEEYVAMVKSFNPIKYHKELKAWELPVTYLAEIINKFIIYEDIDIQLKPQEKIDYDSIKLPSFKTKPYQYQLDGIKYGITHESWLLLDEAGLGKSLQLIYIAQELKKLHNIKHCLIICGVNTLKYNWKKEIQKHSDLDCVILGERINKRGRAVIGSVSDRLNHLKSDIPEYFIITNIETVRDDNIAKAINDPKNGIDMIVIDEVHRVKDPNSQQGKSVLKLNRAIFRIGATGTPLMNSSTDAYVPLQWTDNNHSTFTNFQNYYAVYNNKVLVGHKNLKALRYQLACCSLRRTKEDELPDLPEKVLIPEYVEMSPAQESFYENIKHGVVDEVDKVTINKISLLSLITRLRQATELPSILTTENITSSKIDRACDLTEQILNSDEKVVIFASFKDTIKELQSKLSKYNPVVCTGDQSDSEISKTIDRFQNDPECKVMLATWQKMGVGITLTAASHAIFISTPWTDGEFSQACDRLHRIGAKGTVFIHDLIIANTIDERVWELINEKKALSDYVVDNVEDDRVMQALWQYLIDLK